MSRLEVRALDDDAPGSSLPHVFGRFFSFTGSSFLLSFGEECRWKQRFLSSFFSFFLLSFLLSSSFFVSFEVAGEGGESHGTDSGAGVGGCCWAGTLVVPLGGGGLAVGARHHPTTPHPAENRKPGGERSRLTSPPPTSPVGGARPVLSTRYPIITPPPLQLLL